ncbi:MAG: hypothetical protein ACO29O_00270 [Chitinophagaceae bacterium]
MRYLFFILLIFSFSFKGNDIPTNPKVESWIIEKKSSISIEGSSNINSFVCELREYLKADTLTCKKDEKYCKLIFAKSILSLDIKKFDCHQKFITSDFRKMMQEDQYPSLIIQFISLDDIQSNGIVNGKVEIQLAGRKRLMDVQYNKTVVANNQIMLEGGKLLRFSDFELRPPTKLGGMIRINEDIKVNFNLFFHKNAS